MAEQLVKETPEGEVSPAKKKGIPMVAIIAAVAVVVGAGGFFVGKILSGKGGQKQTVANNVTPAETTVAQETTSAKNQNGETDSTGQQAVTPPEGGEKAAVIPSEVKPGIMELEEFTVNLNDPFGKRYANMLISLEIDNKELVTKIKENELLLPRIRDVIFMIISAKSYNDLNSVAGKISLKDEIRMRVNEILHEGLNAEPVKDVFFSKFLIQ